MAAEKTTRIGKYEIVREIGRGAMGVVYEGRDPVIGRKVAIKTIRFDVLNRPDEREEAQQRFIREARSAGNLSHPAIVTIYDVGEDAGLTYIAMEFVDGGSLESLIAARTRLPLDEITAIVAQIGDALDYAHRQGIIHRDIKPANILMDRAGRPRIVDFGIAKIASSDLTQTNMVMGTPYYMAPEQIAGSKVDGRADMFSLGTILYELLTLAKPFGGTNMTTVIYKIIHDEPPPPRKYDASLPPGLDYVLEKALAKDPARRYQNGRELTDDLRNHAALVGKVFAAATQAIPETAKTPRPAPAAPAPTVAGAKPRQPLLILLGAMMLVVVIAIVAVLLSSRGRPRPLRAGDEGGPAPNPPAASGETLPGASSKSGSAPAETAPRGPDVADLLRQAQAALQGGSYERAIDQARQILSVEPGQTQARDTLALALLRAAPLQAGTLVNAYGAALRAKVLPAFYRANAAPEIAERLAAEAQALYAGHDQFQANLYPPSTEVIDNRDGTIRAEATFAEILTALDTAQRVRVVLFEGRIRWRLERRGAWLITNVDTITSK